MITNGQYYLITTSEFFLAPDGEEYHAAWGKCVIKNIKEVFGFDVARPSTNWYCEVGEGENQVIIAGCHIHYAVQCKKRPKQKKGTFIQEGTGVKLIIGKIFFTE